MGLGLVLNLRADDPGPLQMDLEPLEFETGRISHFLEVAEEAEEFEPPGISRHKGEEGKMGKPTSKSKSGLYALKGPKSAVPQMARNFDPAMASRGAGILGVMQQQSGHFVASPYGGAFAVGNHGPLATLLATPDFESRGYVETREDTQSTFSIDVDTGAYTLARKAIRNGNLPAPGQVRIEEFINYFDYGYADPMDARPFAIHTEMGPCPWAPSHKLVRVGLQGKHVPTAHQPRRNLVFLLDVSGSMSEELPMVVAALRNLTQTLDAKDRIAIVVYAGAAGVVLEPTPGNQRERIISAMQRLEAGGSTNGGQGIELAYKLARAHFDEDGINRVILATDGDFNVGTQGQDALVELIEKERDSGVYLSVLGFGGANYQDAAMEQLADHGNGNYAYIDEFAEAHRVLVEQANATLQTIAQDVKIQVEFDPETVARWRLIGYDNRVLADRDFADDTKDAGEIGAGHNVTALYEVVPDGQFDANARVMELRLRHKAPGASHSELSTTTLHATHNARGSASFRFAAATAGFAMWLQNPHAKDSHAQLETFRDLAAGAIGEDPHARRRQLVELMEAAGKLADQELPKHPRAERRNPEVDPEAPDSELDAELDPELVARAERFFAEEEAAAQRSTQDFILEVLRLLPPLLALPLFVMAFRKPRRRRD